MFKLRLRRAYELPDKEDGCRILVDRLWPRGLSRAEAKIDLWLKDIAPSTELRKWYGHELKKWPEFREKYFAELNDKQSIIEELLGKINGNKVTLIYSSQGSQNNAVVLKDYLETKYPGLS